nr:MAG TPA: hypothetical protein [Caudoviricetes sp.]
MILHMSTKCPTDTPTKPEILGDEDLPFPDVESSSDADSHAKAYQLKAAAQKHNHEVENYKNIVGGILLGVCFSVIVSFAVADAVLNIESSLFSGAFEFAKTIATAVIGYLFATNINPK